MTFLQRVFFLSLSAGLWLGASGFLSSGGKSPLAHSDATLAVLPDGRVLVMGGATDTKPWTRDCETLDFQTGQVALLHDCPHSFSRGYATLLADGRVFVCGTEGEIEPAIYDPANSQWSKPEESTLTDLIKKAHRLVLLENGNGESYKSLHIVDSVTGNWNVTKASTGTAQVDGAHVLIGQLVGDYLKFLVLDLSSGKYTDTGPPQVTRARYAFNLTPLGGGKVLLCNGQLQDGERPDCEVYDLSTNTWSVIEQMPTPCEAATATCLPNGKVLVVGGELGRLQGKRTWVINACVLYDPATGHWSSTAPIPGSRAHHTAQLLPDGKVIVFGGRDADGEVLSSYEIYDPATGRWEE